ncbi:hypothetical protein VTL71DRAFT_16040 [Oculimacula yallundae]|uniref:MARVEL domain-containing protein n=1 Tax=Oculimacula yallundae TaxID=86028 RepID=A0ABR4CDC4_9HELO
MSTNRSHIPALPTFIFYIRYAQLLLAVVVLMLTALVAHKFDYSGLSVSLFTASITVLLTTYNIVATTIRSTFYNYWLVLVLDISAPIFWAVTSALLSSEAASWSNVTHDFRPYRILMAVSAGFSGFEFFLFAITLGFSFFAVSKHRSNGGHSYPLPERDHVASEQRDQETVAPPLVASEQRNQDILELSPVVREQRDLVPPRRLHNRPIRTEAYRPM